MNRKLGLMFAAIVTLAILWVGTTGAAWASPASGTVPGGTGPYRVYLRTIYKVGYKAVYTAYFPTKIKLPLGLKYLEAKGAANMYVYKVSNGLKVAGTVGKICGLIKASQTGMMYRLVKVSSTKNKWVSLPSTLVKTSPRRVCTSKDVSGGTYALIGK